MRDKKSKAYVMFIKILYQRHQIERALIFLRALGWEAHNNTLKPYDNEIQDTKLH